MNEYFLVLSSVSHFGPSFISCSPEKMLFGKVKYRQAVRVKTSESSLLDTDIRLFNNGLWSEILMFN